MNRTTEIRKALRDHCGAPLRQIPDERSVHPNGQHGYIEFWHLRGLTLVLQVHADNNGIELFAPVSNSPDIRDTIAALGRLGVVIQDTGNIVFETKTTAKVHVPDLKLWKLLLLHLYDPANLAPGITNFTQSVSSLLAFSFAADPDETNEQLHTCHQFVRDLLHHCQTHCTEIHLYTT
jgi:hypothetical protein